MALRHRNRKRRKNASGDALICRSRLITFGYMCRIDSDSWCISMARKLGIVDVTYSHPSPYLGTLS